MSTHFKKGNRPWNKGLKGIHLSPKSEFKKGRTYRHTEEAKEKVRRFQTGRKHTPETIEKLRRAKLGKTGELANNWQGGITPINNKIRASAEYKLWREAVFARDGYKCIWCGDDRGGNLNADHIKPFYLFPELRFAIDNGRTLCEPCHRTTETYGRKVYKLLKTP